MTLNEYIVKLQALAPSAGHLQVCLVDWEYGGSEPAPDPVISSDHSSGPYQLYSDELRVLLNS